MSVTRKIVIILQSQYVASWFAETLLDYSAKNDVEISLFLTKASSVARAKIENNKENIWEKTDLTKIFPTTNNFHDALVLKLVGSKSGSPQSFKNIENKGGEIDGPCNFIKPGLSGMLRFVWYFLMLGKPLFFAEGNGPEKYGSFFQVRTFNISKNVGFLRYNLEKILDFLLYQKPHGFSLCSEEKESLNFVVSQRIWKFFWYVTARVVTKFKSVSWHLVKTDLKTVFNDEILKADLKGVNSGKNCADPMMVETDNGLFLFFEEIVKGKGQIAVSSVDRETLRLQGEVQTVLQKSTHLSYPFVFQQNGSWYMLPENSASGQLTLYKSEAFPGRWAPFKVIFENSRWLDTTPYFYNGKWWIFSVHRPVDYASSYQELHLFFCDDILKDEWISHPCNPVVSDVRHARPGGRLFEYNGKLFRPAQNCFNRYGGSLMLCEVQKITETEYQELIAKELKFPWYSRKNSFHTLAIYENMVVGDCSF